MSVFDVKKRARRGILKKIEQIFWIIERDKKQYNKKSIN
jgi:hypothetical protein